MNHISLCLTRSPLGLSVPGISIVGRFVDPSDPAHMELVASLGFSAESRRASTDF